MRTLHDLGPEIRRAISGNLDDDDSFDFREEEPMHRVIKEFMAILSIRAT